MTVFEITYDPQAKAGYIALSDEPVAKTLEYADFINLDLNKRGDLIGIELLGAPMLRKPLSRLMGRYLAKVRKLSETEGILRDPEAMAQIRRSEEYFRKGGKGLTIEEVFGPDPPKKRRGNKRK